MAKTRKKAQPCPHGRRSKHVPQVCRSKRVFNEHEQNGTSLSLILYKYIYLDINIKYQVGQNLSKFTKIGINDPTATKLTEWSLEGQVWCRCGLEVSALGLAPSRCHSVLWRQPESQEWICITQRFHRKQGEKNDHISCDVIVLFFSSQSVLEWCLYSMLSLSILAPCTV